MRRALSEGLEKLIVFLLGIEQGLLPANRPHALLDRFRCGLLHAHLLLSQDLFRNFVAHDFIRHPQKHVRVSEGGGFRLGLHLGLRCHHLRWLQLLPLLQVQKLLLNLLDLFLLLQLSLLLLLQDLKELLRLPQKVLLA